jgi:adenosine deaminase
LARNSFEASFVTADERRRFIDELDAAVGADASPSPDVGMG